MRNFQMDWVFPEIVQIPASFQAGIGGSAVVSQTLYRRGVRSLEAAQGFLNPDLYQPSAPSQLPGIDLAVDRIQSALARGENILVWGDFDVDGQTSTTLLVSALSGLGSGIDYYIPNRAAESHGVSLESLEREISRCRPSLLITCDTGIDAVEPTLLANSSGVDVIITDHHQLPAQLPPALAIINPNLLDPGHKLINLPGVGVAYKLIEGLYQQLSLDPAPFLDLVALGIVADVAQQTHDTRYLLQLGLDQLRRSQREGIKQLCKTANLDQAEVSEEQIGFALAPRLNALGRLDDASTCVEFFTTKDPARATELALHLEDLNAQRQQLTETIFRESLEKIESSPELVEEYPIIVLQGSSRWHPGVIGIVASRIVERFHKPVIMLSKDGETARGSARSVPGVPISALISESASLLNSFGGHPMAAGLSLDLNNVSRFRYSLKENYDRVVGTEPEPARVFIDAEIPFNSISIDYIEDFQRLAPFGAGNPKLLFATRAVHAKQALTKLIGKNSTHKKLVLADSSGAIQDFLWWNSADIKLPLGLFDIVYSLDLSTYRNRPQVQATLRYFREVSTSPLAPINKTPVELLDYRSHPSPSAVLSDYIPGQDTALWGESNPPRGYETFLRSDLPRAGTLIVWTTPPSREIFNAALSKTRPNRIVFFARDPKVNSLKIFITKLHGLLKYYLESGYTQFDPDKFAQAIAVTPSLVEVGLEWIHHHGDLDLSAFSTEGIIRPGPRSNLEEFSRIDKKLKFMLREMNAYREYFSKAKLETLL